MNEPVNVPHGCDQIIIAMRHHIVLALGQIAVLRRQCVLGRGEHERLEKALYDAVELANRHDRERQRIATDRALVKAANFDDDNVDTPERDLSDDTYVPAPLPTTEGCYLAFVYNDEEPTLVQVYRHPGDRGLYWIGRHGQPCALEHNKIEWIRQKDTP